MSTLLTRGRKLALSVIATATLSSINVVHAQIGSRVGTIPNTAANATLQIGTTSGIIESLLIANLPSVGASTGYNSFLLYNSSTGLVREQATSDFANNWIDDGTSLIPVNSDYDVAITDSDVTIGSTTTVEENLIAKKELSIGEVQKLSVTTTTPIPDNTKVLIQQAGSGTVKYVSFKDLSSESGLWRRTPGQVGVISNKNSNGTTSDFRISAAGNVEMAGSHTFSWRNTGAKIKATTTVVTYECGKDNRVEFTEDTESTPWLFYNGKIDTDGGNPGRVGIMTKSPQATLHVRGNFIATNTFIPSDKRFKKNIRGVESATELLELINGVRYEYRRDEHPEEMFDQNTHIGFIAQEVQKVFPELVSTRDDGYLSVDYSSMTPVLVEAIKEIGERLRKVESMEKLEARLARLEQDNQRLQAQLNGK